MKLSLTYFLMFLLSSLVSFSHSLRPKGNETSLPACNGKYPEFGRNMRCKFLLKKDLVFLDHGSHGAYPKSTMTTLHKVQYRIEANPSLWLKREAKQELEKVKKTLGHFLNADSKDLAVVINTTAGMNAVLRSLIFSQFERILLFSTTFKSMKSLVQYVVDTSDKNVTALTFPVEFPISNDQLVQQFETFLDNHEDDQRPIKLAILDHISSTPGVVMPIHRLIPILRSRGILVLIDGAHAIGQIPIDLQALDPDYYITNGHKWFYTARGLAILYTRRELQASLHPAHITHYYSRPANYENEFFWAGTMDYASFMTLPTAFKFRQDIGGEERIRNYTNRLAREGGNLLAEMYGTRVLQEEDQIGSMIDVELCLKDHSNPLLSVDWWIDTQLYRRKGTYITVHKHGGKWWGRHSAQIYNDIQDFTACGEIFLEICDEINSGIVSLTV